MKSKIPMRTCIGCGEKQSKGEMLRIVKTSEGEFHIDPTGRLNGRGCYVCRKAECMDALVKQRKLNRSYRENVDANVCETLMKEFESLANNGGSDIGQ